MPRTSARLALKRQREEELRVQSNVSVKTEEKSPGKVKKAVNAKSAPSATIGSPAPSGEEGEGEEEDLETIATLFEEAHCKVRVRFVEESNHDDNSTARKARVIVDPKGKKQKGAKEGFVLEDHAWSDEGMFQNNGSIRLAGVPITSWECESGFLPDKEQPWAPSRELADAEDIVDEEALHEMLALEDDVADMLVHAGLGNLLGEDDSPSDSRSPALVLRALIRLAGRTMIDAAISDGACLQFPALEALGCPTAASIA